GLRDHPRLVHPAADHHGGDQPEAGQVQRHRQGWPGAAQLLRHPDRQALPVPAGAQPHRHGRRHPAAGVRRLRGRGADAVAQPRLDRLQHDDPRRDHRHLQRAAPDPPRPPRAAAHAGAAAPAGRHQRALPHHRLLHRRHGPAPGRAAPAGPGHRGPGRAGPPRPQLQPAGGGAPGPRRARPEHRVPRAGPGAGALAGGLHLRPRRPVALAVGPPRPRHLPRFAGRRAARQHARLRGAGPARGQQQPRRLPRPARGGEGMNPRHRPSTQTTTARMRLRIPAAFAFAFAFLFGLAHAQDPAAAAPQGQELRQSRATLRQLGVDYEITLRGIEGTAGVPFPVRSDQVVQRATLHLKYSYSPALLPDLSHLKVTVNGVTAATVPVPSEDAGRELERDIELDPRLFVDHNWINLQLIGHYTRDCEDPDHTSLWANIDRGSYVELAWAPLQLANDLSLLPLPFFDPRDTSRLELPFVFPGQPSNATVQAAGVAASWFGAQAGYRGALFPTYTGMLPVQGNAVVFGTTRNPPPGIQLPEVNGPTLAITN